VLAATSGRVEIDDLDIGKQRVRALARTNFAAVYAALLDPSAAQTIRAKIKALAAQDHCGIQWTSHNMNEVETVCDRVLFLSRGKVLLEGNPRTLAREHDSATLEDLFIRVAREPLAAGAADP
jgi:ABC-2 type transport system ATP-binding protein